MNTTSLSNDNRVIVLFGGTSSERLVSTASAQNLASRLRAARYVYWRADNRAAEVTIPELVAHTEPFQREFRPERPIVEWPTIDAALDAFPRAKDGSVVFLALHGGDGENGVIQRKLEDRSIAYTGSDSRSSALAFDKKRSKDTLRARGVRLAAELIFSPANHDDLDRLRAFRDRHGRLVLKPVLDGSSVGLAFIDSADQLDAWWQRAKGDHKPFLAEERLEGRELTVGMIQRPDGIHPLPPSEVILERDAHFDYEGKYLGRGTREITPAEITADERLAAQEVARLAHSSIGCAGYTRTDMIFNASGFHFLEINTLPGMTKASFIPQQLAAANIPLDDFLTEQLAIARSRG